MIVKPIRRREAIGYEGPFGREMSRFSHLIDNRPIGSGEVFSLTNQLPVTPGKFLRLISFRGGLHSKIHSTTAMIG
jgi:hypothetical protein